VLVSLGDVEDGAAAGGEEPSLDALDRGLERGGKYMGCGVK
jgi:hypothetical protein